MYKWSVLDKLSDVLLWSEVKEKPYVCIYMAVKKREEAPFFLNEVTTHQKQSSQCKIAKQDEIYI